MKTESVEHSAVRYPESSDAICSESGVVDTRDLSLRLFFDIYLVLYILLLYILLDVSRCAAVQRVT